MTPSTQSPTLRPRAASRSTFSAALIGGLIGSLFGGAVAVSAVVAEPPHVPSVDAACESTAELRLLDDLDRATESLRDFSARIVFEKFDDLTEEAELRYGRVVYQRPLEGRHRAAVLFDRFIDSSGRSDEIDQRYVFVDGWLVEIDGAKRQFIKRQIVDPRSDQDPLRLGEGPLLIPFGQRRADIESTFRVSPAPPPTGRLAEAVDPASLRSLRLTPIVAPRDGDGYQTIDLHYDRETLLPALVLATDMNDSRSTVRILDPRQNTGLTETDDAMLSARTPSPTEWTIDIRPWRESPEAPASETLERDSNGAAGR